MHELGTRLNLALVLRRTPALTTDPTTLPARALRQRLAALRDAEDDTSNHQALYTDAPASPTTPDRPPMDHGFKRAWATRTRARGMRATGPRSSFLLPPRAMQAGAFRHR